jgi:hypothetical protein
MKSRFAYLIKKVNQVEFSEYPFRHIEINDFINEDDFNEIISCDEINIPNCDSDNELFKELFSQGFKMTPFPGAITDHNQYMRNRIKRQKTISHSTTESAGVVLRLVDPKSERLKELKEFLESKEFNEAIARKFSLELTSCSTDGGIQKYLDEYEISPHPDLRKKAATYMVNINNSFNSEEKKYHTHYLKFKPERNYVSEYWKGNPLTERCWVPWDWCISVKQQVKNNSLVAFSPSFDTLHAVKASYNHLTGQRTQLYGNLWYKDDESSNFTRSESTLSWEEFNFQKPAELKTASGLHKRIVAKIISKFKKDTELVDASRRDHY